MRGMRFTGDGVFNSQNMQPGRQYLVTIFGTWGGGTMTVQFLDPTTGTARDSTGNTFTADAEFVLLIPSTTARFTLAGASSPDLTIAMVAMAL
jgi:hypothetical protein